MTQWEYTYLWWETPTGVTGSAPAAGGHPITEEILDKLNDLGSEGWEITHITAAPLNTGWTSPRGHLGAIGITDKVHYLTILKRAIALGTGMGGPDLTRSCDHEEEEYPIRTDGPIPHKWTKRPSELTSRGKVGMAG